LVTVENLALPHQLVLTEPAPQSRTWAVNDG